MGYSRAQRNTKIKLLDSLLDSISDAQKETLSLLSDVDQVTDLMTSLMEAQTGKLVSFDAAFSDL